jgi:hypothetical protein
MKKYVKGNEGIMTGNPLDTCGEECVSGIIQGNYQQSRNWFKERNHIMFAWIQDSNNLLASSTSDHVIDL